MANRNDPKGYYARIGVLPNASAEEIKKAYRARAMDFHPDRNTEKDTTRAFQDIQEAYAVLSDAKTRAEYDSIGIEAEQDAQAADHQPMEPVVCSKCGCVSAQPRYAIFYEVKSYIFATHRSARQGIFCAECAAKEALKASAITWFLGWWGFPWGPLYTVPALFTNMLGGERPKEHNARIMAYQAAFFATNGKIDLARAVAMEALALAIKIKSPKDSLRRRLGFDTNETASKLVEQIKGLLHDIDDGLPFKRLKPQWGFLNRIFAQQGVMALAFCGAVAWATMTQQSESPKPDPAPAAAPAETSRWEDVTPTEPMPMSGVFKRYVKTRRGDPMPPFKISTSENAQNWLIKLCDQESNLPVMTVFVRAGETVEVKVPIGSYRVKFASGERWYGESNLFGPDTDYSTIDDPLDFRVKGNQLVGHALSLTAVPNGNLWRKELAAADF